LGDADHRITQMIITDEHLMSTRTHTETEWAWRWTCALSTRPRQHNIVPQPRLQIDDAIRREIGVPVGVYGRTLEWNKFFHAPSIHVISNGYSALWCSLILEKHGLSLQSEARAWQSPAPLFFLFFNSQRRNTCVCRFCPSTRPKYDLRCSVLFVTLVCEPILREK
jgi:hypothetical protein